MWCHQQPLNCPIRLKLFVLIYSPWLPFTFCWFHFSPPKLVPFSLLELGVFMRTEFLCIAVLRVASGSKMKLASCKSASTPTSPPPPPVVYSTDRSKAVVPMLVLLFVALWFILRGDFFYVLPCVILFLCFSVLLALRLPRLLGEESANLSAFCTFVRFALVCFVCFLFLFLSGKGCGLWLWHSLNFSLTFFFFFFFWKISMLHG